MQQSYFYHHPQQHQPVFNQEGGGQWLQDSKTSQYQNTQWDNNQFHVTGGSSFVTGPVAGAGGGAQNRVPQQPNQPTPTSTPPGGMDLKPQQLIQNQSGQINFVPRPMNQSFSQFRGPLPPSAIRTGPGRPQPVMANYAMQGIQGVLTQASAQPTIVQTVPAPFLMYQGHPSQRPPFPTQSTPGYMLQQGHYPSAYPSQYYNTVPLQSYQNLSSGGPSPQAGSQQPPVSMIRPPAPAAVAPQPKTEPKKRLHAIKIINPETNEEVVTVESEGGNNNNITPTRSNDSSARQTPQPNAGVSDTTVAADFAARVAARAMDDKPSEALPDINSDSETQHKHLVSVVPSNDKGSVVLNLASEEFVPRSLQQLPGGVVENLVPTVSAEVNAPAVEIQRESPLRSNKKQKSSENVTAAPASPPLVVEKKSKPAQKEESAPAPKERRENKRSVTKEQSPALSPETPPAQPELPPVHVVPVTLVTVEEPISKAPQQNGEAIQPEHPPVTPLPPATPAPVDGSKTARQKNKKTVKMRELNRKGVEKEGSEMDAFTTEPSLVSEEPPSPPPSPTDKIKDDMEEKEDKLVAAKNEENTKVSALSKPLPVEEPAPVIEKSMPQLTLKRSYKKDQWSPLNPEGKKVYERDFLMELKGEPQSNQKPDNLPDVVAVLRDATTNNMRNPMPPYMGNRGDGRAMMMPEYYRNSSQSQRGASLVKRGSQQGSKGGKNNPKVIHMSLSLNEDVKLKTVENAWKPGRVPVESDKPEDKETQELLKNVRGILNKLTPQKFDTLMKKFLNLPINSEERLKGVIGLIFEKAVDEPSFSKAYANMCKMCARLEVTKVENGQEQKVNFRKILITRCQEEFENKPTDLDSAKALEEINNCNDPEKKKELQLIYEEKERAIRMKSVGNIRFIGELFKLGMLTPAIMYRCLDQLLQTPEEESLECLCKLLTTIGKDLEQGNKNNQNSLQSYFQRMGDLAQKKEGSRISSRVRFMLQDVIELRLNKWVPRREDNNPKTIEQINQEVERENTVMNIALSQQPQRMNRPSDRPGDDRRKGNRGNNQGEDGWNTVTSNSRYHNKFTPAFEASKMQNMVKTDVSDLNSLSLGGSYQYRFNVAKTAEAKSTALTNPYAVLQNRTDDKKPPPPQTMNRRQVTPTTSIEKDKERQRMIQGAMESEGRASRGSSAGRERGAPVSRESSLPRQPSPLPDRGVLDQDKLDRQTNSTFDEYLAGLITVHDVRQEVERLYPVDKVGDFVQKALDISLDKKPGTQHTIGLLISALMDFSVFTVDVLADQLAFVYENIDDIAIDVPKVWETQAQVIAPIIASEKMNFSHFKTACGSVLKTRTATKLLVPVFNVLVQQKGVGFVRKVWDSSQVSLKDFLCPEVNIDAFIKENSLEYLTGEAPKYDSSTNFSMDQIQEKMLRLLQSNQPYEKILDFISSNVGEKVKDLQFIRALITAICEACISGPSQTLDTARLKQYEKLIQRYVDHNEENELACLTAVHNLMSRLQHPQGLILNIFNFLLEESLISCDSFLKWKDDEQEILENKGVSLLSLTSFFSALEDVETDDENS